MTQAPKRPETADPGGCYAQKKANKRLFNFRSLKRFGFDQDELTVVYKSNVRPVIEYVDVMRIKTNRFKQSTIPYFVSLSNNQ